MFLESATTAEPLSPLNGDCNGDGEVTIADAVLLARFVAEDTSLTDGQIGRILDAEPDCDSDGLVTILDVAALLKPLGEE
ncbi:MAG: dockerin type I repeat-containing protein [Oscillospiraceae bacterium]|nr:dockerin type I repeat-containing protein [Oscillospiraceae bacterium]